MALSKQELQFAQDSIRVAAHLVLFNGIGETLILRRENGLWLLPGGRMDLSDAPKSEWTLDSDGSLWSPNLCDRDIVTKTLERELREEIGLSQEVGVLRSRPGFQVGVAEWFNVKKGVIQNRVDFIFALYLGGRRRIDVTPTPGSEIIDSYWTNLFQPTIPDGMMPENVRGTLSYTREVVLGHKSQGLSFFNASRYDIYVPVVPIHTSAR